MNRKSYPFNRRQPIKSGRSIKQVTVPALFFLPLSSDSNTINRNNVQPISIWFTHRMFPVVLGKWTGLKFKRESSELSVAGQFGCHHGSGSAHRRFQGAGCCPGPERRPRDPRRERKTWNLFFSLFILLFLSQYLDKIDLKDHFYFTISILAIYFFNVF